MTPAPPDPDRVEHQADARLRRWCYGTYVGIWLIGLTIAFPPTPRLVWNASDSMPRGLYRVYPGTLPGRGDIALAYLPSAIAGLAAERHYLAVETPVVKPVAAIAGDVLCARGRTILVNGRRIADRLPQDRAGQILPAWRGCRRLADGEWLLLSTLRRDSFDGRYFGVTTRRDLVGKAVLLWRR